MGFRILSLPREHRCPRNQEPAPLTHKPPCPLIRGKAGPGSASLIREGWVGFRVLTLGAMLEKRWRGYAAGTSVCTRLPSLHRVSSRSLRFGT